MNVHERQTTSLENVQSWLTQVITSRGDLASKLKQAESVAGSTVHKMIQAQSVDEQQERLSVYVTGYVLRLVECLKEEYPLLNRFLGDELFETFAKAYLIDYPSKSWTLHHLGEGFSWYLKQTQPIIDDTTDIESLLLTLPAQIAVYERAKAMALLLRGTEQQNRSRWVIPGVLKQPLNYESWIQTPPCMTLLSLDYPVWSLEDAGSNMTFTQSINISFDKPIYLLISRKQYRPINIELECWQYELLSKCQDMIKVGDLLASIPWSSRDKTLRWLNEIDVLNVCEV